MAASFRIVNSTFLASSNISPLPLHLLTKGNPIRRFDACSLKTASSSFLIFRSGKIVCLGLKNIEDKNSIFKNLALLLRNEFKLPNLKIESIMLKNLVSQYNLAKNKLPLPQLYNYFWKHGYDIFYDPENYPALRLKLLGATLLVFHTGKITITGCKTIDNLHTVKDLFDNINHDFGVETLEEQQLEKYCSDPEVVEMADALEKLMEDRPTFYK